MAGHARRVFLYIGAAKSGTTYLQQIMWNNRDLLRDHGFLYPGAVWASHVFAALDLRLARMGEDDNPELRMAWRNLTDEVVAWDGDACIAQELIAPGGPRAINIAMSKLSAVAEVHVVWTARDMARVLPASWQEWVRNREVESFEEYLAAVIAAAPFGGAMPIDSARCAKEFWALQDATSALARWGASIPPEHVHVITVPQRGAPPTILWDRFAQVTGLGQVAVDVADKQANSSLSAAGAGLVRDLNQAIGGEAYPWRAYDAVLKHDIVPRMSEVRGTRIELPEDAFDWSRTWAESFVELLAGCGYDIVGDLEELTPATRPTGGNPGAADPAERSEVALVAMTNFARRAADAERHIADLDQQLDTLRGELDHARSVVAEHRELAPLERVKRCGVELADQVGWLHSAHEAYRRARRRRPS